MNGFIRFQQDSDLQLFLHLLSQQPSTSGARFVRAKREPMIIFENVPKEHMAELKTLADKHEAELTFSRQYSPLQSA
jgi:hypothetical protein